MNIKAYEEFLKYIKHMTINDVTFLFEKDKEKGFAIVNRVLSESTEMGSFGERRIALENLLDNLSELGLFLPIEQINLAEKAFGDNKNDNEKLLIDYYKKHLVID